MSRQFGDIIKKAFLRELFTKNNEEELEKCFLDPLYFMETYLRVQHPTLGSVPFKLYDFQKDMVRAYHNHRNVVACCGRQQGKCLISMTFISKDKNQVKIGSTINLTIKEKLVDWLEEKLIKYSKD